MTVLGLKIIGHDTGAALIADERVCAVAEERLNRVKHSRNMFPELSIDYCLRTLNVSPSEVDLIVIDQIYLRSEFDMAAILRQWSRANEFTKARIEVINHQDAHAAHAFFCSPFSEAAILIYDGAGEAFSSIYGLPVTETETLYYGQDNKFHQIQKTVHPRIGGKWFYTFGVGKLYDRLSQAYLNFGYYNEGKMMGLAAYGDDSVLRQFPLERWRREYLGHIVCNARINFPEEDKDWLSIKARNWRERGFWHSLKQYGLVKARQWLQTIVKRLWFLISMGSVHSFVDPNIFAPIVLPQPPRRANYPLPDKYYASVAYAGQKVLEDVAVAWGKKLKAITRSENLCLAGGVGLNIDANKNFLDKAGFKRLFVQPGASDTGIPLGCALYGWHVIFSQPRFWEMKSASLGRLYTEAEIRAALREYQDKIAVRKSEQVEKETAAAIAGGKIIGWFHGGSEYGPRALGNRSILVDARQSGMKDILNKKVKHREPWRPFAASVLEEKMSEWFDLIAPSPFMLLAASVHADKRDKVPAIVHADGTCRIQSVTPEANERYYNLINEFSKLTGVPLVLNTSFNLAGEPIIETPADALKCFLATQMDWLVLEDYIITKK